MKLNFNFKIKSLDGKEIPNSDSANKLLANVLSQMNKGNSIKMYDWALKLWNSGELEIDDTDSHILEGIIDSTEFLTVLSKVPMMNEIKKKRESKK